MSSEEYGGDAPRKKGSMTEYPALGCPHCPATFFNKDSHIQHVKEQHPKQPRAFALEDDQHRIEYHPYLTRQHPHLYVLSDKQSGKYLSNMVLNEHGEVSAVETHPEHRRQGLAKKLWQVAQENTESGAPAPRHSRMRTAAGEKWAKGVGGEVPPRAGKLLSQRQMQGMIDFSRQ